MRPLADGVASLPVSIANVYFVGPPGAPWVLVDAGLPNSAAPIRAAAEGRYGADARPAAILLTHGHGDHVGSALDLANIWDVPIYAHRLEMPYLDGRSEYPPPDPTVGGALAFLSRFIRPSATDLRPRLHELPADGVVPGLPDWRWLHTPGHAPGHVCFFREGDRTLLAGDAFATVNLDSLAALLSQTQEISGPPAPITCDWAAARESVALLAALKPYAVGCGHGLPLSGSAVATELRHFADTFAPPARGRYVGQPARADEDGLVALPPPAPDPLPGRIAVYAGLAAVALGALAVARLED